MSQKDRRVLRDLRELGAALDYEELSDYAGAGYTDSEARDMLAAERAPRPSRSDFSPAPYGDIPLCACGKVPYATRAAARIVAGQLRSAGLTAYVCPLGHAVYHLHGRGRSRRERTGAR